MNKKLIEMALDAQENAYAPYSDFLVGAALLSRDGQVFTGCNIESVSFAPTICAERTAIVKAVSVGVREFTKIAIVGCKRNSDDINYISPCGVCRQTLVEFCHKDFSLILAKSIDDYKEYTLEELLPCSFSPMELLDK